MRTAKAASREHILQVAGNLFFRQGYRAVGVDTIVEQSGVAKMTLYRYFASKDDLIVAYLEQMNTLFWQWFDAAAVGATARDQLLGMFAALERLITTPACYGCPFLNVTTEFPELDHPGHRVAQAHKEAVLARLHTLAEAAGAHQPTVLASQLGLLMDGAFMRVRVFGPQPTEAHLVAAAAALLDVR